jgi:outer membrane protein
MLFLNKPYIIMFYMNLYTYHMVGSRTRLEAEWISWLTACLLATFFPVHLAWGDDVQPQEAKPTLATEIAQEQAITVRTEPASEQVSGQTEQKISPDLAPPSIEEDAILQKAANPAPAQPSSMAPGTTETLMSVYHAAQLQDPQYAAARAAYLAGVEKGPQGLANLLPDVSLNANTLYNRVDNNFDAPFFPGGETQYNFHDYTLSLTQPLFHLDSLAQYEQSKHQVTQAEIQLAIAEQELVLNVAQAYFDVLFAKDTLEFTLTQKTAVAEQLAQAQRNFEVGTATITDAHEAQARYDLIVAAEIAALNDLEIKKQVLQRITGVHYDVLSPLGASLPLDMPDPPVMDEWVRVSGLQNLQLRYQQAALKVAEQEVKFNQAGHFPTLDLVANYGESFSNDSNFGTGGNDQQISSIGFEFNLPLFQGGEVASKVREAHANKNKARDEVEFALRQASLQTREAFFNVTNRVAKVRALGQALISNQSALDSTQLGLEVGIRTNVDVLNARLQLFITKRDLSRARYDYILSRLQLKAAVGMLSEADLTQINSWLEAPQANP